ncbi:hypothetical protein [Thioalkalivibrio sp. HL-Eb18]|uniref:hypothetical protein n=1 Tax=Thioalkalivibrio sp. HL-Eb18 TaxID=1266913 RepID=UPI00036D6412|nr:hypothetical protein [Thioalkalivibrio sp. HL-Eb18]
MGKNVDKLQNEIAEALKLNEQHADAADDAAAKYQEAVAGGDVVGAAQSWEQERQEQDRLARSYADRVTALKAKMPEAESKDAAPAYRQAVKDAEAAVQAEADAHTEFTALVEQLAELRKRLDDVHAEAGRTMRAAFMAADSAHKERPDLRRSNMSLTGGADRLLSLARELANVSNDQSRQVFNTDQQRRKAA